MNTEAKLKDLCAGADEALGIVNRRTRELFALLADDAKRFKFEFTPRHGELIADITHHGRIADSAAFVEEKVLDPADAYILDIELTGVSRTIERLTREIEDKLHKYGKTDRKFVYLAWKSRPETYYYAGKAGSPGRVNLAAHGKLLEALKEASRLSFIFPAKSTDENISNLEAAVLNLVEFTSGSLPKHNSRKEKFALHYECGNELRAIRKLISQIHSQIE
jgi:predicted nucleic acid-binding protein